MAIFKDLFSSTRTEKSAPQGRIKRPSSGPETLPVKMDLEERMAFRRELLFEIIRASLSSRDIERNSYRFKAVRTDKRGHCHVVMFDMSPAFMESEQGQHAQLAITAAALTQNALARYGLVVTSVYWRVDETLATAVAPWALQSAPADLAATPHSPEPGNIEKYEQVTAEELAEFEAAWQKSSSVQIGSRTYSSDLAPLAEDRPAR